VNYFLIIQGTVGYTKFCW